MSDATRDNFLRQDRGILPSRTGPRQSNVSIPASAPKYTLIPKCIFLLGAWYPAELVTVKMNAEGLTTVDHFR